MCTLAITPVAAAEYYYFHLLVIFHVTLGQLVLFWFLHLGISGTRFFTFWISFLSPNHQCQSTEGNTKLAPLTSRGVRNVINCRPGTRINFERVPGYPLKIHNSTITVIESCWIGRRLANN